MSEFGGRVVHLTVETHLDGQNEVNITLTETPRGDYVFEARPKGKRIVYSGMLSDATQFIAARHAKQLAAANGIAIPKARKGR